MIFMLCERDFCLIEAKCKILSTFVFYEFYEFIVTFKVILGNLKANTVQRPFETGRKFKAITVEQPIETGRSQIE